jgi:hypothetical protein
MRKQIGFNWPNARNLPDDTHLSRCAASVNYMFHGLAGEHGRERLHHFL